MPGRKGGEYNFTFMTRPVLYRTVEASDDLTPAGVEDVQEEINRLDVNTAYGARMVIGAVSPEASTYGISVYVDLAASGVTGDDRWCLLHAESGLSGSTVRTLVDVPCGTVKILVTDLTGGPVKVIVSQSL